MSVERIVRYQMIIKKMSERAERGSKRSREEVKDLKSGFF